jgi:peptidoglycan DL-endopeptidase CwlO
MEPSQRTARRRTAVVTAAFLVTELGLAGTPATARPNPPMETLRQRADRLNNQLEQLTEQYNGLKVRLRQAQSAAAFAETTARRASKALRAVQHRIGRLAAIRYMSGGAGDAPILLASPDPRTLLDQAATLHYFTQQDDTEVRWLTQALQNAQRSRQEALDRTAQTRQLRAQLAGKKVSIQRMLDRVRKPLLADALERAGRGEPIPAIPGGSSRAIGAVRAALSQLGVAYVWGGATPRGGFDCSGLTMWSYRQVGINLPHYGGDQWNAGVHIPTSQLQPGDLVFFYSDIHHMGMYIGNGKFVHAPHTGDHVRVADLSTRPLAGAVRVV